MTVWLLAAKVVASMAMVLGLAWVAERVGPRVAGVLSGYPLGVAVALFFVGVENGADFAARSAVYTMAGFSASLALVVAYRAVVHVARAGQALLAPLLSVPCFLVVSALLSRLPLGLAGGTALTLAGVCLSLWHFRDIENAAIDRRVRMSAGALLLRATAAAAVVLLVTGWARVIGEEWTGVLAAFPVTLFPFLVIIHWTHGWPQAQTIIKHFPLGMGALLLYTLVVALAYPRVGVLVGTGLSFCLASVYLWGALLLSGNKPQRNRDRPDDTPSAG
jgi:hypothetical protein